jgi:hypothetical protein
MIRTTWTIRLGILGAIVSAAVLVNTDGTAAATSAAQSGFSVSGVHANEEFCKTMVRQAELAGQQIKASSTVNPDMAKRAKIFADMKALNATHLKAAPASLASDVARATKNSDAGIDAQVANNSKDILAFAEVARSPEYLAISRRMGEYCGVKF